MTRLRSFVLAVVLSGGAAACASTPRGADEPCEEPVVTACQTGSRVECDTDADGCEYCTCVPIGGDTHGPLAPE